VVKAKPYDIPKQAVWEAFQCVKANKGTYGIDEVSIVDFEEDLKNNLYKIWNRMSSGSYFPSPVRAVDIPKKNGGKRTLGIPTVGDRVAQMVVKEYLERLVEPHFRPDSFGYRPGKSALQAIEVTRKRCWQYDWVVEFDIKGLFDNIPIDLMLKAVKHHTDCKWVLLYIERWLTAPMQTQKGDLVERKAGTPQGGVISPLLANLFLHYAFDKWMERSFPKNPWVRYSDDGLVHCGTRKDAETLLRALHSRFKEVGLELHEGKTRIIYCKDDDRRKKEPVTCFDFLGYTFRPRRSKNRYGKFFVNFTPAVSSLSAKTMRQKLRGWRIHRRTGRSLEDVARGINPVIRGWINYYGRFYKSELYKTLRHINLYLVRWVCAKYKKFKGHKRRAEHWLGKVCVREPKLFVHWLFGMKPTAG
jgi:RNA-directed DNA polymerase